MDWQRVARDFEPDGALRDIYVRETTLSDWQSVLNVLREWEPAPTFMIGGEPAAHPEAVEDIFAAGRQHGALLSIMVGDAQVNCHFFVEDEIEFDLDPREVTGLNQVEAIVGFMTLLGDVTGKAVTLTMENTPEAVIFRRLPGRQSVEWVATA